MLLPIAFPIIKSVAPFPADDIVITNSGIDVPNSYYG
jgi:hypothetical protein